MVRRRRSSQRIRSLLLFPVSNDFLLEHAGLREAQVDPVGGQGVVAVHDGVQSVLHGLLVEWVQLHLAVFSAVEAHSH